MLNWMIELWNNFAHLLVDVLPHSPFESIKNSIEIPSMGLQWLNWLLPIPEMIGLLLAWITAYALYLIYRAVLRWLKIVG